jgi:hypothetical protein
LTASAATFAASDVVRLVRILFAAADWTWVEITGFTSSTVVDVTIRGQNADALPHSTWRLGAWSATTGYPAVVTFHEDRLCFGGEPEQRIDMSNSGDYENFAPSEATTDTITDAHALSFTLNSNDVNNIRWMISEEKALLVGTVAGEWAVRPSVQSEAISPTNINAKQVTSYGSSRVQPVIAGKSTLFTQRSGKKVREISYYYEVDGFRSPDRTALAEHITGEFGLRQMAHQKEPQSIVWCVRQDGVLAAMTYEREEDFLIVAWSRHILGGASDAANSDAIVESVEVIPSPDTTRYEPWVVVKRRINGGTKRYIEYLTKIFEDTDEQKEAFFVDSGLTYDSPIDITGATQANPVVVTAPSHGFSNGDYVLISDVLGMEELNGNTYVVRNKTANTFELEDTEGNAVDGSAFDAYVADGLVRKYVTVISGLWHLEGQSVTILGDGAVQSNKTVTNGSVTLATRATTIHFGLGYNSDVQMLRLEAGSADGSSLGKIRRIHRVAFLVNRSLGLKLGTDFDNLDEVTFRTSETPSSRPPELFTGILTKELEAGPDEDNQICWRTDQPLPSMILAVVPNLETQDRL